MHRPEYVTISATCLLLNKIFSNEIRHSKFKPACPWKSCTDQTHPAKSVSFILCSFLWQVMFLTKLSLYGNRLRKSLDPMGCLTFPSVRYSRAGKTKIELDSA